MTCRGILGNASVAMGALLLLPSYSAAQGLPGRVEELETRAAEMEARLGAAEGRIGSLEARVAELAGRTAPLARVVDCGAGETVAATLAAAADHVGPLTITIRGTCTESVTLTRDNVTLRGAGAGDGLRAPASAATVLSLGGARDIVLSRLTLDGGGAARGLQVRQASVVSAFDVAARPASRVPPSTTTAKVSSRTGAAG
jgi:hypothetical protein